MDVSYYSIYEKVKAYVRVDERYKDIWWHLHNTEMNIRQKFMIRGDLNIQVAFLFAYLHEEKYWIKVESLRATLLKDLPEDDYDLLYRACKLHKELDRTGDITIDICFNACRLDKLLIGEEVKLEMATDKGKFHARRFR